MTNAFATGTSVWYFGEKSTVIYGTVLATNRLPDHSQFVVIKEESGRIVSLPAAAIFRVVRRSSLSYR